MVIFHSYVSLPEGNGAFMVDLPEFTYQTYSNIVIVHSNQTVGIYLGKFDHDLTAISLEIMVRIREIIPFYGPTFQVSELLFHLPKSFSRLFPGSKLY
jgi:hypothetical protein